MRATALGTILIFSSLCLGGSLGPGGRAQPDAARPKPVAPAGYVAVRARQISPQLVAFGHVEPIAVVAVAAFEAGVIEDLRVRPGARVHAGELLARLGGPAVVASMAQGEAGVRSARAQLTSAEKSLALAQQQLPTHLATRQMVQQAEAALAQSRSALDRARSLLAAARQMTIMTAPSSGTVLSLSSADGALVSAGQSLLTIRPDGGLWLRAMVYGASMAAVRVGMAGRFAPADGSAAVAVRVVAVPGAIQPGGGEAIALQPAGARAFHLNGEAGTVALRLPARPMVEVPTRALIVDQGKWWVLVHTPRGDQPREVVPGPSQGWNTWIQSGLAPGADVVVNNAYLRFHAGIAAQFQLPD